MQALKVLVHNFYLNVMAITLQSNGHLDTAITILFTNFLLHSVNVEIWSYNKTTIIYHSTLF